MKRAVTNSDQYYFVKTKIIEGNENKDGISKGKM